MTDPHTLLHAALGNKPFPWQDRLLDDLLDGRVPRALDLPTGLGKTSVIAIWLVARATGAALPRRLVYVVDRRAVVDQATREAERLRDWAPGEVRAGLGLGESPLPISTLRGQFVDNKQWLDDPSRPAIIVGTVDMVGSRLLFEGYGSSRKMRPYQAGLLGADVWFVVDEAHLVPPFERLLEAATQLRGGSPASIPPIRLLSLSATGRDVDSPFRLDQADHDHPVVKQRIKAEKRLSWETLPEGQKLRDVLAARALSLAEEGPTRVLVFTNRRDDAESVAAQLEKAVHKLLPRPTVELLVGARRVQERVEAQERLQKLGFLAGSERPPASAFLVATSAGEVGIDLDADHVACDAVAWERMVQRLGRVNRRGERAARVLVVADPKSEWVPKLVELVEALPPTEHADARLVSPAALGALRASHAAKVRAASSPEPLYPALTVPLLEAWSMTSLRDHTGRPEVAPWLRGWIEEDPQTTVVWRTHLPRDAAQAAAYFEAAPPHTSETLETETYRVVEWLEERCNVVTKREPPVQGEVYLLNDAGEVEAQVAIAAIAAFDKRARERFTRSAIGRTVVVPSAVGGLTMGLLDPKSDPSPATGDAGWDASIPPIVPFRVSERTEGTEPPEGWRERLRLPLPSSDDGDVTRWLVVDKWGTDASTEDDRSSSRPQSLVDHQSWAAEEARALAVALGLAPELGAVLELAARLHDEGKRAPRWQRAFRAKPDQVYAKTRGPLNVRLLDGYRHEFGSLPYAEADPAVAKLSGPERDLVLHLIAAHHGGARPLISWHGCDDAPPSQLEARAREVALRFVRLQERWGPWGLAWLEALLRSADQRASRRNDVEGR
jgi:CRISPR-associated endonuclease/helicase Cas3